MEAPRSIYLQEIEPGEEAPSWAEGMTWCTKRINDSDIEYVRLDVAVKLRETLVREWLGLDKPTEGEVLDLIDETAFLAGRGGQGSGGVATLAKTVSMTNVCIGRESTHE